MVVDVSKGNHPVTKFDIHPIVTPIKFIPVDDPRRPEYEKPLQDLTPSTRRAVVDGVTKVLRDQHVIPDTVETMISALEKTLKDGDYGNIAESEEFAARLSADLQAFGHDKA